MQCPACKAIDLMNLHKGLMSLNITSSWYRNRSNIRMDQITNCIILRVLLHADPELVHHKSYTTLFGLVWFGLVCDTSSQGLLSRLS